ncbi:MAG TPA: hypothetical protein VFQ76_20140 [Longimicrobiaceae bacterium]|nr:hypothetical protein [Longimicrobiaceae bacterium]
MKALKVEPVLVPVRGEIADAVHAIAATSWVRDLEGAVPVELAGAIALVAENLARDVVLRALGREAHPADMARGIAAAQVEVLRELAAEEGASLPATLADLPPDYLGEVAAILSEAALEYAEHEVLLGTQAEDGLVLFLSPVTAAQAHVRMLEPMYERIEDWVAEDDLRLMERAAARWWFARWTPPGRMEEHLFARGVREQEFALVDRPFLALEDRTAIEHLADTEELDGFPPKQRHMAMQLLESVVGVWEVLERSGADAVLRAPLDGKIYPVKEHAPEDHYGAGFLALGRLIPFGDGTWLRSPGAVFFPADSPHQARAFAEALGQDVSDLPVVVTVEALISTMVSRSRPKLPREVRPAPSAAEAEELLEEMQQLMREAGLTREATRDELPPDVDRSRLSEEGPFFIHTVDVGVADWLTELGKLVRKGQARRDRRQKGGGKRRKGKAGRRRR